jgi:hypothetical protein
MPDCRESCGKTQAIDEIPGTANEFDAVHFVEINGYASGDAAKQFMLRVLLLFGVGRFPSNGLKDGSFVKGIT